MPTEFGVRLRRLRRERRLTQHELALLAGMGVRTITAMETGWYERNYKPDDQKMTGPNGNPRGRRRGPAEASVIALMKALDCTRYELTGNPVDLNMEPDGDENSIQWVPDRGIQKAKQ